MSPAAPVTRTVCIMLQLPTLRGVTRIAELRRECLIALAAVEQMPAHCCASLCRGACADRTHDCAMLLLEHLAVGTPGQPRAAGNSLTRDDEAPEMFQEAPELWIVGGIRDAAMKRKILIDRVLAPLERAIDHIKAIDDLANLGRRGALGGQTCGLDFNAGAQFHDFKHFTYRRQAADIDAERPARILGNESPDTLPGYHQPLGAQRGHGFAHDRSAHPGCRNQLLLGREACARRDVSARYIGSQPRDELMRERFRRR